MEAKFTHEEQNLLYEYKNNCANFLVLKVEYKILCNLINRTPVQHARYLEVCISIVRIFNYIENLRHNINLLGLPDHDYLNEEN